MRKLLFILLTAIVSMPLQSQVSKELIESKIDSGYYYSNYSRNLEKAKEIAAELIVIGQNQKSDNATLSAYFILGTIHYYLPTKDSALYWYSKAQNLSLILDDKRGEGRALRSKGIINIEQGN